MRNVSLTGEQVAKLSEKLRLRYAVLWDKSSAERKPGDSVSDAGIHDMHDESYADESEDSRLAELRHDALEMTDIEQALARIHVEAYGICTDCGTSMGYARLEAYPTAKRCRDCQEKH